MFDSNSVHSIHRSNSKNKTIIVRFISVTMRNNWLIAKRRHRLLKANQVNPEWNDAIINVNEPSSFQEREIFRRAKKLCTEQNKYKVWMKRGLTFLKTADNSPPIKLLSLGACENFEIHRQSSVETVQSASQSMNLSHALPIQSSQSYAQSSSSFRLPTGSG